MLALNESAFARLLEQLKARGYRLLGPRREGEAIVYGWLESARDLPRGWSDEQAPGYYRLKKRGDEAYFGYAAPARSLRHFLQPPRTTVVALRRSNSGMSLVPRVEMPERIALIGVRACDLSALGIQDRVLMGGTYGNSDYSARRRGMFIVAVNCTAPGATCFCTAMQAGPHVNAPFDLALTELVDDKPRFVMEVGSVAGRDLAEELGLPEAPGEDTELARANVASAAARIDRAVDAHKAASELKRRPEHPRWQMVAERCLACGNCTLVCPTCFCTAIEDRVEISGDSAVREERWDSCFTQDYSYIHGGAVRASIASRYRQWLTHKFSTWHDQFGTSGCVGCGRCITFCPVGIDVREEVRAVAEDAGGAG